MPQTVSGRTRFRLRLSLFLALSALVVLAAPKALAQGLLDPASPFEQSEPSPEAAESREAFRDADSEEALFTAQSHFPEALVEPVFDGTFDDSGWRVVSRPDAYSAIVDREGVGGRYLVE